MTLTPNRRMALVAVAIYVFDQITKFAVLKFLGPADERVVIDGFFKFVHWVNTGAAWSLFHDNNELLAIIAIIALLALFIWRHHFDIGSRLGQVSLGLIFGGIVGNLTDRFLHGHVIDFARFYLHRRGGGEIGFPAFNIADSAICIGVVILFILSWRSETEPASVKAAKVKAKAEDS
jgi:signal peptidase II